MAVVPVRHVVGATAVRLDPASIGFREILISVVDGGTVSIGGTAVDAIDGFRVALGATVTVPLSGNEAVWASASEADTEVDVLVVS